MSVLDVSTRFYNLEKKTAINSFGQVFSELITNSIDAYINIKKDKYKINIEYDPDLRTLTFLDTAGGMTESDLKNNILTVGNYTSYGSLTRGMMGRGAKDVSNMGKMTFTCRKNGEFSSCYIDKDLEGGIIEPNPKYYPHDDGTHILIELHPEITPLSIKDMIRTLRNEFSLRKYLDTNNHKVEVFFNNSLIKYQYPKSKLILDTDINVVWPSSPLSNFKLWFADEIIKNPESERERRNGILIYSDTCVYEICFLEIEGEYSDFRYNRYSKFIYGELYCPYIDNLIRQHTIPDSEIEPGNHFLMLEPSRKGLLKSHPFVKALFDIPKNLYSITLSRVSDTSKEDDFTNEDITGLLDELSEKFTGMLDLEKNIYTWRTKEDQELLDKAKQVLENSQFDNEFYNFPDNNKTKEKQEPRQRGIKIKLVSNQDIKEAFEIIHLPKYIIIKINLEDCAITMLESDIKGKLERGERVAKNTLAGIASILRVAMTKILTRQELIKQAAEGREPNQIVDYMNKISNIEVNSASAIGSRVYRSFYDVHISKCLKCQEKYKDFISSM